MITNAQTNTVYLADDYKKEWPEDFKKLKSLIEKYKVPVKILKHTKDRYCRDYMPIQVSDSTFVQFIFKPEEYFEIDWYKYICNPIQIGLVNKLQRPFYSNIILDGGNIVKWSDKVIIADKVYDDNLYRYKSKEAIRKQLEDELKCKVIIIPRYPNDKTGHADGLIRFINSNKVFINEEDKNSIEWQKKFHAVLNENNLEPVMLPCTMEDDQETGDGLYINYLHVGNLVIVPQFGRGHADEKALHIMEEVMGKTNTVVPYNAKTIAEYGGVLNCATWTVKEMLKG
jgi:agmatine deiminase